MGCTSSLVNSGDVMVCELQSYLIDGCSPDIDTSTSDWASQLVTVRRSGGNQYVTFPHVLLTFGFDTAVSLTRIEMDWFLCPDWGIGTPSIIVYLNEDYNLANTNILTLPFVFADNKDSLQSSCESLSTVTFSGGSLLGTYYHTIHILVTLYISPSINRVGLCGRGQVHWYGESRFRWSNLSSTNSSTASSFDFITSFITFAVSFTNLGWAVTILTTT